MSSIVVTGATGNAGQYVVLELALLKSKFSSEKCFPPVRLVTRDVEGLQRKISENKLLTDSGFTVVEGDVTRPKTLGPALEGASRVFFCLPQCLSADEMTQTSSDFLAAAKSAGVKVIVRLSSFGIDARGAVASPGVGQGPLGDSHARAEAEAAAAGLVVTSVRPTSFTSNFLRYDLPTVRASSEFASPLGSDSAVNWVACSDVGAVAAVALSNPELDGRVLDVTGPPSSTLSARAMSCLLSRHASRDIGYRALELPSCPSMRGLWVFLRAGGFNYSNNTVQEVTGREPSPFSELLESVDLSYHC